MVFGIPRKYFILPFIMAATMVPMNQRIDIVGLDFTVLRMVVLTGVIRIVSKNEIRNIQWNSFDKLIFAWNIIATIVYVVQWSDMPATIRKFGVLYDSIGMYWLFRQSIKKWDNINVIITSFAVFAIISSPLLLYEKMSHNSIYEIFGPVAASFHRGRFRCSGPFPHYIILGCFWASILPLIYSMVKTNKNKVFFGVASSSALICIYTSASSTPIMTVLFSILLWFFYKKRFYGKKIFLYCCIALVALHLFMNMPIWHLISRVNVFGGSTGWHRYYIFDQFVIHLKDWFLLGCKNPRTWSSYHGMGDITNQFMLEGIRGGFISLLLFIIIMYKSVKISGAGSIIFSNHYTHWICWSICVSLMGHIVTFWGVSYFGEQMVMLLYLTFAMVGFIQDELLLKNNQNLTLT